MCSGREETDGVGEQPTTQTPARAGGLLQPKYLPESGAGELPQPNYLPALSELSLNLPE